MEKVKRRKYHGFKTRRRKDKKRNKTKYGGKPKDPILKGEICLFENRNVIVIIILKWNGGVDPTNNLGPVLFLELDTWDFLFILLFCTMFFMTRFLHQNFFFLSIFKIFLKFVTVWLPTLDVQDLWCEILETQNTLIIDSTVLFLMAPACRLQVS